MRRLTQAEILDLLDRVEARSKALEAFRAVHSYEAIGRDFGVHPKTVTKWVMRHGGIDAIRGGGMSDECDMLRAENERLKMAVLHLFQMAATRNEAGETMLLDPYCPACIDAKDLVESLRRAMKK